MRAKRLSLVITVVLAAGGWWLARSAWRAHAFHKSRLDVGVKARHDHSEPGQRLHAPARLAPPDPLRRFRELTPEQRVKLARQGPIGG